MSAPITGLFAIRDGVAPTVIRPSSGQATRGFGGHVAALALAAAYESVPPALTVHHVHIEFLRPAAVGLPLRLDVRPYRDGRSIARRTVEAGHPGEPPCAVLMATFNRRDDHGLDFGCPMPAAPDVDQSPLVRTDPVEVRHVIDPDDPAHQQIWIRPHVRPLAAEPALQHCALLFLSDFTILWPTMTVHGLNPGRDRHSVLGSVAHTMWFHRDGRADDWLLYDQRTPTTSGGLGHAEGRLFSRSGVLLATVAQVGLLRPARAGVPAVTSPGPRVRGGGPARPDGR